MHNAMQGHGAAGTAAASARALAAVPRDVASVSEIEALTPHEIIESHSRLVGLRAAIEADYEGRQGRYNKVDTARVKFLNAVAFPYLRLGKRLDDGDWMMLFADRSKERVAKDVPRAVLQWAARNYTDPRRETKYVDRLEPGDQRTMLYWLVTTEQRIVHSHARNGRPAAYRLQKRDAVPAAYLDRTVAELCRMGRGHPGHSR